MKTNEFLDALKDQLQQARVMANHREDIDCRIAQIINDLHKIESPAFLEDIAERLLDLTTHIEMIIDQQEIENGTRNFPTENKQC